MNYQDEQIGSLTARVEVHTDEIKEIKIELKDILKNITQIKRMVGALLALGLLGSSASNAITNIKDLAPILESIAHAVSN